MSDENDTFFMLKRMRENDGLRADRPTGAVVQHSIDDASWDDYIGDATHEVQDEGSIATEVVVYECQIVRRAVVKVETTVTVLS